ncbi:hypothetical protein HOLleu_21418 [Holothuria leucospilota]|uniref:Death domain-containing protein n=1 Tax=Holothuria leucospilota TaxID=206669 RepID=A0A9Q1BXH4_HOLLE|nr:hypothetical protein HOLleu_21418 [Holothuria leucospilota]
MERCSFDDSNQERAPTVNSPQYGLLPFREVYTSPMHFPVVQHYEHTQHVYFNREIENSCLQLEYDNADQPDEEDPLGHDWKQLADELGFSMEEISAIERRGKPTFTVIQSAVKKGTLTSPNHLKMILEKIQRFDAAALISDEEHG